MEFYKTYKLQSETTSNPTLILDLQAFKKNMNWIASNSGNKKIRIATKSIRCRELLKCILSSDPAFQGLMSFDLREALWLKENGFKDILMGYPTTDLKSLEVLVQDPEEITLMTDLPEHLNMLNEIATLRKSYFNVCIDVDLSLNLPGLRFGVFRSNLNSVQRLLEFINHLKKMDRLKLKGFMGYEAQIAGVGDLKSPLIRILKKISIPKLRTKRKLFLNELRSHGFDPILVNGGGTGSLLSTREEASVTEITVGSGLFAPALFDDYKDFKLSPALFFSLPIVRRPENNIFTCLGGGYIGSGAVGKQKLPLPFFPSGIKYIKNEGAGEVQTPFVYEGNIPLKIGDPVIFRHSKAGEICERFNDILVIKDESIFAKFKTYRGEGKSFL